MAAKELVSLMDEVVRIGFLDRTIQNLRGAWRDVAERASGMLSSAPNPELTDEDAERLRAQMRECLQARGGEVSARARAASLGRTYLSLNAEGCQRFLNILANDFDVDRARVDRAVDAVRRAGNDDARRAAEASLRAALVPPRVRLLTQFNALPEGVKFLVDMRARLLEICRGDPGLEALEADLKGLLSSWFDVGFLELRRITWDSPAALLEKLIAYEAVHAINGWDDLKNRLDSDRRCFAFIHPRMPDEPLIFVEVALVNGMSDNIQALLDKDAPVFDPVKADTAIFYSISNAQHGLAGISFGNFLIKRVVDVLAAEFKGLKTFATLSPAPKFRAWLEESLATVPLDEDATLLTPAERKAIAASPLGVGDETALATLLNLPAWHEREEVARVVRGPLLRLCAVCLMDERAPGGRALDPVANFHLSNGARIERINWLADTSEKGFEQSFGMMVNYLYKLDDIEANHEAYSGEGKVAASAAVRTQRKG